MGKILALKYLLLALVSLSIVAVYASSFTTRAANTAADAASIFSAKCAKCHGEDGRGVEKYKKKGVKDFTDAKWQKARSDAQLTGSIANGKGETMPAWKTKLSADEIKGLVAHIRAFKK